MNHIKNTLQFLTIKNVEERKVLEFWEKNGISVSPSDTEENLAFAKEYNPELFVVSKDDKGIASTCWGTFDGRRGYIIHLCVRKDLRGKGLGKLTMEKVEKEFERRNVYKLHLFVEKENLDVCSFYKQLGYHVREDIIVMSKKLWEETPEN